MSYCKNCGTKIDYNAVICPKCGVAQKDISDKPAVNDSGSIGWAILGFCTPLVGFILFLVWKNSKPNCSKSAGIGALISFAIIISLYIILTR